MHVYLNPDDLLLMAEKCGFSSTKELFDRGLVKIDYSRDSAPRPRIRFKEAAVKCCPFLENRLEDDGSLLGLCSLHPDSKPLICGLAPLFREVDLDAGTEVWGFKAPYPSCPGCRSDKGAEIYCAEIRDPAISKRLDSEKRFFSRLMALLNAETEEGRIIEELYYRSIPDG
jgi:hypothetical protein